MSFAELLLALIVGVFILKPSDWKIVIRTFKNFTNYLRKLKDEIFSSIEDDDPLEDQEQINRYLEKIISLSGKYEGEYDLASIKAYYHKLLIQNHKEGKEIQ